MRGFDDGQIDGATVRREPRRLSQVFAELARDADKPVSLQTIRDALGDRGFAGMLIFFALLNMIPLPPPASAFLGLPLIIISAQMAYGTERAWLPQFIMNRSVSPEQFRRIMDWTMPRLIRLETVIRPRYWPFWGRHGERAVGVVTLLLGIIVTLPIPLGNWLPACATAIMGVALSERDGILLVIGGLIGVFAVGVIVGMVGAAGFAVNAAMHFF